jgi:hypothetical protein
VLKGEVSKLEQKAGEDRVHARKTEGIAWIGWKHETIIARVTDSKEEDRDQVDTSGLADQFDSSVLHWNLGTQEKEQLEE